MTRLSAQNIAHITISTYSEAISCSGENMLSCKNKARMRQSIISKNHTRFLSLHSSIHAWRILLILENLFKIYWFRLLCYDLWCVLRLLTLPLINRTSFCKDFVAVSVKQEIWRLSKTWSVSFLTENHFSYQIK